MRPAATTPSFVTAPFTVPVPVSVVATRSPDAEASSRAPAPDSRITLLCTRVAPDRRASVPFLTVVAPVYVTAAPVSVVVAAPDCTNEPPPLRCASEIAVLALFTTSVPSFTTRRRSVPVSREPSRCPEPSRSTAPFCTVVEPS